MRILGMHTPVQSVYTGSDGFDHFITWPSNHGEVGDHAKIDYQYCNQWKIVSVRYKTNRIGVNVRWVIAQRKMP